LIYTKNQGRSIIIIIQNRFGLYAKLQIKVEKIKKAQRDVCRKREPIFILRLEQVSDGCDTKILPPRRRDNAE
jgi:hypothetical protein